MDSDIGSVSQSQICRCESCVDCMKHFQKIAELKGLIIYRHVTEPSDTNLTDRNHPASKDKENLFILQNKNDVELTSADYLPELEEKATAVCCEQHRLLLEQALKLLKGVSAIERNTVNGICDHCWLRQKSCLECQDAVKKFFAAKGRSIPNIKEHMNMWLSKVTNIFKDISFNPKQGVPCDRTDKDFKRAQSELRIDEIFRKDSKKEIRELDIHDLLPSQIFIEELSRKAKENSRIYKSDSELNATVMHDDKKSQQLLKKEHCVLIKETPPVPFSSQEDFSNTRKIDIMSKRGIIKPEHKIVTTEQIEDDFQSTAIFDQYDKSFKSGERVPERYKDMAQSEYNIAEKIWNQNFEPEQIQTQKEKSSQQNDELIEEFHQDKLGKKGEKQIIIQENSDNYDVKRLKSTIHQLRGKELTKQKPAIIRKTHSKELVQKNFYFSFPHEVPKKKIKRQKDSAELIRDTKDILKDREEEKRKKIEEERRKKSADEKNKQLAREEKAKLIEENKILEEGKIASSGKSQIQKPDKKGKMPSETKEKEMFKVEPDTKEQPDQSGKSKLDIKTEHQAKEKITEPKEQLKSQLKEKPILESKDKSMSQGKDKPTTEPKEKPKPETEEKTVSEQKPTAELKEKIAVETKEKPTAEKKEKLILETKEKSATEPKEKSTRDAKEKSITERKEKLKTDAKDKPSPKSKEKLIFETKEIPITEFKEKPSSEPKEKLKLGKPDKVAQEKESKDKDDKMKAAKDVKEKGNIDRLKKGKQELDQKEKAVKLQDSFKPTPPEAVVIKLADWPAPKTILESKKEADSKYVKRENSFKGGIPLLTLKKFEPEVNISQCKLRKDSVDDLVLKLVKMRNPQKIMGTMNAIELMTIDDLLAHKQGHNDINDNCPICVYKNFDIEVDGNEKEKIDDVIVGQEILKYKSTLKNTNETHEKTAPLLFKANVELENLNIKMVSQSKEEEEVPVPQPQPKFKGVKTAVEQDTKGVIRYALSDRSFIDKGWTVLPTEKIVRKLNVYRMRPAHPEFDWFTHNKNKRLMHYDTGERLAEFDDNGRGRWYYRNGRLALDYYDCEEMNAQQRFVIYSNGEPDERNRFRPFTVLGTFDYLGNGIVFDHFGKIRLKYNQTEGVVLDRSIGPVSHWKWHTLNDPPVLQQVMIDTQLPHKDPTIYKMAEDRKVQKADNEDMLAIEFDNFIKEKSKKLSQSFKPYQIKMKALKINEHFSLRVLDQATIYLIYRDGTTNLKLNIGMILDHKEIVDTDTAEVGEVSNNMEKFPAITDSLAGLQKGVEYAQRVGRIRGERERLLRRPVPTASVDKLNAPASRPMRLPLRTVSTPSATTDASCKCSRKPKPNNVYYSNVV